jgi:diguanylate cyclase (GGDEF)-like protein
MGGEEFILLMPNTQPAGALSLAEKLRDVVRESPLALQDGLLVPMTASFGVTGLQMGQQAALDTLYATADQALYVAKEQGRDRVVWLQTPAC